MQSIVGLPLGTYFRAADMRMFGFGKIRPFKKGQVCDYSLHILCSWRLVGPEGIITGHRDLWEPVKEDDSDEEWNYENGNLQDKKLEELFSSATFIVQSATIKNCGDLEVVFSGEYKLQTFLDFSRDDAWLIFQPGNLDSFFHMDQELSKTEGWH
ncbi:MAG: hypothetical protein P0S96_00820 [Simkaniaceae bacterium]|nr:hypothetical protein [Candidatus Sacchlamyda saccharinae]